jgi:hypothetical protein
MTASAPGLSLRAAGKEAFEIGRRLFSDCRPAGVVREEEGEDGLDA